MPLAPSARWCRLLMQFVFPFQPRDTPAARASRLPWTISISSTPLGKYSAHRRGMRGETQGFFPSAGCNVDRGWSWSREQRAWERRRRGGSARLAGQPGTEAPSPPQGCGRTVCSDLSAVWSPGELLLGWLPGISPNASSSLALFRKQL